MKEIEINGEKYFCDFEKDIITDGNGIEVDEETRKLVIEMIEEVQKQAKEQVFDNIRQQNDIQLQNEKEINDKEDSKWLKRFKCCYEANFEYINYVGEILTYKGNEYVVESQVNSKNGKISIIFDIDDIPHLFEVEKMVLKKEIVFRNKIINNKIIWKHYKNNIGIYFIKQTISYPLERKGKFLWAPMWPSYECMQCLKPGDITINYYRDNIVSICVITETTGIGEFPDREGLETLPKNFLWVQEAIKKMDI